MQPRSRAVIIGVNADEPAIEGVAPLRHAVDDATAIHRTLTDPEIGTFDPVDVELLIGATATTRAVKSALRRVAREGQRGDTLLVYFAGHGILDPLNQQGDPYLVTADLALEELELDPDAGLRMGFLQRDVFGMSDASGVLLLDCCHAGASIAGAGMRGAAPAGSADHTLLATVLALLRDPSRNTHQALVACPRDAAARESDAAGHGLFTAVLLDGLNGGADQDAVTLELLSDYVNRQKLEQQPGRHLFGFGTSAVLTRPSLRRPARRLRSDDAPEPPMVDRTPVAGRFGRSSAGPAGGDGQPGRTMGDTAFLRPTNPIASFPLPNPLDGRSRHILRILDDLFNDRSRAPGDGTAAALGTLQRALSADAVFATRVLAHGELVLHASSSRADAEARLTSPAVRTLLHSARLDRRGALGYAAAEDLGRAGERGEGERGDGGRCSLVVPLSNDGSAEFDALVLHRLPDTYALDLGEAMASMVRAFVDTANEGNVALAELGVLNHLRLRYGRLPIDVYDRAFELFVQQLAEVRMVFEPMVKLGRHPLNLGIIGWEALARLGDVEGRAPAALFETAAVWGDRFVIELDSVLADRAIERYVRAWRASGLRNAMAPLSVNVSPRSIWSDAYIEQLIASMERNGLDEGGLTLELSEKEPIVLIGNDLRVDDSADAFQAFRARLEALARAHHVAFAIDDFGAGHASLDRLSMLDVSHVKIDRAILHHTDADVELRFVLALAERRGIMDKVIVEGVDEQSPLSLKQLWDIGVRRIQGYITERGTDRLDYLKDETTERLAALVRGEDA
ncbi:MAG: EAL domain-containing protein [Acidimicrobiales bacterium]|nr:EAL domain-containing protein [Acidimicrobiales bacterium]